MLEKCEDYIQSFIEEEIRKSIMGSSVNSESGTKTDSNPISDLNNMIVKISTVIMCSENDKKKLEEQELPGMTTIIPNQHLEDGTVYMIADEKLKKSMLEGERIRRLRQKQKNKSTKPN